MRGTRLFKEYDDLLSVADVKKALKISSSSAYQLVRSGALCSKKVAGQYRITKDNLIRYICNEERKSTS